jgi:hypothetical protein
MKRWGGTVPVILAWLEVHPVAGADLLDGSAFMLAAADAFGDVDGLAVGVRVPSGPGAGSEVDEGGGGAGGRCGHGDRVDVDGAREPFPWASVRVEGVPGDLHVLLS